MEKKDGALVIETRLSTEKFDTDLKKIDKSTKNMINRYNKSVDSIKSQELAIEKVKNKIEELQLYADTGLIKESELGQLEHLNKKLDIMNSKLEESKKQTNELGKEINKNLGNKAKFAGIIDGFDGVGKKIDKLKNRMTRLIGTVAIFSLLRNSLTNLRNGYISLLKQNDNFKNSLNQIKANLMTAFAPIYNACLPAINSLMNALSKVTGTIAVFVSGLFGTSLKDAKKQAEGLSKSLDDTAKSGEKASGSLASFDNLEVIADNSASSGSSSNSGIDYIGEITYSQRLLDILNNIKDFAVDNKELIIGFIAGITGALIALKTLGLDPIKSLGIGVALAGIVYTIVSLIEYIKDPSFENFGKIFQGIGIAIIGVGIAIGALPVAVVGAIVLIFGTIIKYWDQIKAFFQKGIDWLSGKSDFIHEKFGDTIGSIYDFLVETLQKGLDWLDFIITKIKENFDEIISFVKNVFSGNWKGAWQNIKNIFSNIWESIKRTASDVFNGILDAAKLMAKNAGDSIASIFKAVVNGVLKMVENILNSPIKTINKLIGVINKVPGINLGTLPTFKLPRLATGAVIPPRSEFMAILGDQKRGVNIETPLDTMVEAFNKALDSRNTGNGELVIENLTIVNRIGNTDVSKTVVKGVRIAEKQLGKPLFVN